MKKIFFIALLLLSTAPVLAAGNGYTKFGAGFIIGEPSGLSAKYWLSENNAVDFALGYSISGSNRFNLHADYLYHREALFNAPGNFTFHYGFGGRIKFVENGDDGFGVRGVVGANWLSNKMPVEIFVEIAPVFNLMPGTSLDVDAGLGIRYYFD